MRDLDLQYNVANNISELKQSIINTGKVVWRPIIQEYLGPDDEFTTAVCLDSS